ncbi:MAG TPA: hypothetical protein VFA20_04195 [Myxococcaceae bacterium]|nr:hypothetical protein [Myxococcaceae bacterium]
MAEPAPKPTSRMVLAVMVGLIGALLLGGGGMVWSAWRTADQPFDCAGMAPDDCALEQDIKVAWTKRQNTLGLILTSLGAAMGLALWLTERRAAAKRPPRSDA